MNHGDYIAGFAVLISIGSALLSYRVNQKMERTLRGIAEAETACSRLQSEYGDELRIALTNLTETPDTLRIAIENREGGSRRGDVVSDFVRITWQPRWQRVRALLRSATNGGHISQQVYATWVMGEESMEDRILGVFSALEDDDLSDEQAADSFVSMESALNAFDRIVRKHMADVRARTFSEFFRS